MVDRFRREKEMSQRVAHPHLAWTYEVGEFRGVPYIAMEYIQGRTLSRIVNEDGPLTVPRAARLMRGMVLSLSEQDFVQSLRALGASNTRIIFRHLIPNGLAPIWVDASLNVGAVIITEAALSFLGLGVSPPNAEWGLMLNTLRGSIYVNPLVAALPGVMIFMTSMSFNLLSDGLRDAMDVRL